MNIGILDFTSIGESRELSGAIANAVDLFARKIKESGNLPILLPIEDCQMFFAKNNKDIYFGKTSVKNCDAVLARVGFCKNLEQNLVFLDQIQTFGIPVLNNYSSIIMAKNKVAIAKVLNENCIPTPRTCIIRKSDYIDNAVEWLGGGYPVVVKKPVGSLGAGVMIAESKRGLTSIIEAFLAIEPILLLQEYVKEAAGSDYRAFVVGEEVVASMQRTASPNDFRSNINAGGSAKPVDLTSEEVALAIRASRAFGLDFSGVDILRSVRGPLILEVNANPGLHIIDVTGVDVARYIVNEVIQKASISMASRTAEAEYK